MNHIKRAQAMVTWSPREVWRIARQRWTFQLMLNGYKHEIRTPRDVTTALAREITRHQ